MVPNQENKLKATKDTVKCARELEDDALSRWNI